jgi:O-antigen/teichoic acid export membrane protein
MGIVFRQSIKTTLVTFLGTALGALIIYYGTHILNMAQYGYRQNLINLAVVLQYIVLFGLNSIIIVFTPRYPEKDERRKIILTISFLVPTLLTLVFSIPYLLFKKQFLSLYQAADIPFLDAYYMWLPLFILIWSYMSCMEYYLISKMKVAIPAFAKEVLLRLGNLALLVLFYFKAISFSVFIYGSVLAYLIPLLLMLVYAIKTPHFGFSLNWSVFKKAEYKEILHFTWYHLLFGISTNLLGYLDALMLGSMDKKGLSSLAVYSTAVYIISLMSIPVKAMSTTALPILNQSYIAKDKEKITDLFMRSGINILIAGIAMLLIVICNLHNAVAILPAGYEAITPVVFILLIGRTIDMATGMNSELIGISQYYKFNFRISLLLLVLVIFFDRLLIPKYGIYGAAWGTSISLAIFNIGKMLYLWQKMRLQPFSKNTLSVLLASIIPLLIGYYMPVLPNPFFDAIVRTILITISFVIFLLLLRSSPDLNTFLKAVKTNKRLF